MMIVLLVATTFPATAFVLSGQCMAPSPCTCYSSNYIYCQGKSLTAVPQFKAETSHEYISSFNIYLYNNNFTSIPANVFQNVSSVNTSSINFKFDNNKISSISPLAFTGVENTTKTLQIRNNKLTSLPSALGKLTRLENLYLEGNPLVSIDSSVTQHLSSHLTYLRFDMTNFSSSGWPSGLSKLNHLQTLVINYIPMSYLPFNAFAGLESGLTTLTMSHSKLVRIPVAVCHLQNLQTLYFDYNAALESNNSIFEPCSHKLTRLTTLTMKYDNLYEFPDVLHSFPSLATLHLEHNKIHFIHTNDIPYVNKLNTLYLHNNLLTHIPFALNKLKQLSALYLSNNKITTVEDHDLVGLTNLQYLDMHNNPIEYVAPRAFSHNVQLNNLHLGYTNLQLIPEAVRSLPRLTTFYFQGNLADCSCKMAYLKGWNVTGFSILYGACANDRNTYSIKQFLLTDLPNCP